MLTRAPEALESPLNSAEAFLYQFKKEPSPAFRKTNDEDLKEEILEY